MRLRELRYKDGTFTYGQRIEVAAVMRDTGKSEYQRMKAAWRVLYGWNARLMPVKMRVKRFERMVEGLAYWADLEARTLHYEPTAEERRAGIEQLSDAVGDMGTIKALAKDYHTDPDDVLKWQWAKVYGILLTDLEEHKFSDRLRKVYDNKARQRYGSNV